MLVSEREIRTRKCNSTRCDQKRSHCIVRLPLDDDMRERIGRKIITTIECFRPLAEVERAFLHPTGSSRAIRLDVTLQNIIREENTQIAALVTDLRGENSHTEGKLESIYRIRPDWDGEMVERVPLADMNTPTIIRAMIEHPFIFRI